MIRALAGISFWQKLNPALKGFPRALPGCEPFPLLDLMIWTKKWKLGYSFVSAVTLSVDSAPTYEAKRNSSAASSVDAIKGLLTSTIGTDKPLCLSRHPSNLKISTSLLPLSPMAYWR